MRSAVSEIYILPAGSTKSCWLCTEIGGWWDTPTQHIPLLSTDWMTIRIDRFNDEYVCTWRVGSRTWHCMGKKVCVCEFIGEDYTYYILSICCSQHILVRAVRERCIHTVHLLSRTELEIPYINFSEQRRHHLWFFYVVEYHLKVRYYVCPRSIFLFPIFFWKSLKKGHRLPPPITSRAVGGERESSNLWRFGVWNWFSETDLPCLLYGHLLCICYRAS